MIKEIDILLISKYLTGECNDLEIARVEEWISSSNENEVEFRKLKNAFELAAAGISKIHWKNTSAKENILLKIISRQAQPATEPEKKKNFQNINIWFQYAAALFLLTGIGTILYFTLLKSGIPDDSFSKLTAISSPKGSKSMLSLYDGTKIWLNAGSTIKFDNFFNEKNRNLILEGEAYFEVAKNQAIPFLVKAGDIVVQATGTVFNVKAYPDEKVIETTLVEGSVTVGINNGPKNAVNLMPNEQVFYYKSDKINKEGSRLIKSKGIDTEIYTSWINDKLQINGERLGALAIKLERKYDVTIHIEDEKLKNLQFTGILENETIEQILEIIRISSSVKYRIDGREIWLYKK
ncbi:MAG: FecR family protein [Bacteroidales bacterium]